MNLKQLQYFCEVVEAGSAAKAAQTLFVAPTAISMRIGQLEQELGGPLFDRAARPMPLTALGRFLHPRAQELLAQARRLENDARRVAAAREGWLGIGFTRSAMLSLLPTAIRSFRGRHPDVRLDMVELLSEHQPAQLEAGKIHLGIARHVGQATACPPGYAVKGLFTEPLLAALPAGVPQAEPSDIGLAELAALPFITYPRDPKTRYAAQVLGAAAERGTTLEVQHEAMEIHTALGLVAGGLGFALVGASVARHARPDIRCLPVRDLAVTTTVTALTPAGSQHALTQAFLEDLRRAGAAYDVSPAA